MFEELKRKITSQSVLALPKREGKFWVETNASGHAIRGVLSQEQDSKWRPITFLSRKMQPAEQNYEIYDKELLAIVEAITKWRQYLLDATEKFKVWMDHENLKYFRKPHKLNRWQAWWYLKLQDYDFILQHISGKTNMKADVLLRKDHINTTDNNKDIQMFKEEMWTRKQITVEIEMIWGNQMVEETTILEEIWRNGTREQKEQKELKKEDGQSWEENGIIYIDGRIYVPNNQKIKEKILQENHDPVDIGHPGQQWIMELIKRNYWWLGIKNDVKKYIQECFKC